MSIKEIVKKELVWIITVILICSIFIVWGIVMIINDNKFYNNAKSIDAMVVNQTIKPKDNGTSEREFTTTLTYSVDGNEYEVVVNNYNITKSIGDTIIIYYNVDNPEDIRANLANRRGGPICFGFGVGSMIVLLTLIFMSSRKENKIKARDELVYIPIVDITGGTNYSVGISLMLLKLLYKDENGKESIITGTIMNPPFSVEQLKERMSELNITSAPVYLNKKRIKKSLFDAQKFCEMLSVTSTEDNSK